MPSNGGLVVDLARGGQNVAGRLGRLVDKGTFHPWRSAVGDGVIAGSARIRGRSVCIWIQDPTHLGGSLGASGAETIVDTISRANRAGVPVIGIPNSGGARLQEGAVALGAYGTIFREQARASVPQVALIEGVCAGGAAYSPAMGDIVILTGPEPRMFLTGPKVVASVTREQVSAEELGGPRVHLANGVAHLAAKDQEDAEEVLSELLSYLPATLGGPLPVSPPSAPPLGCPSEHLPSDTRHVYDVRDVVRSLVDSGRHLELAARWARNMVTTLARLDGRPVGFIANQPRYLGGTIDSAAAEKGAWFVNLCDRLRLPLVVLVDTPGFLPGTIQERAGVIRRGAALLAAFARATTTKITVTLRQAYGGAHIVMNSRGLGSDLTLAWTDSQIGIMGAHQAVQIINQRTIAAGANIEELAAIYSGSMLGVDNAALMGSVDEVIEPAQTRTRLISALELYE